MKKYTIKTVKSTIYVDIRLGSKYASEIHCVKSVRIRSYSGPHFPAFGLNTERYFVSVRIQSGCGKIRTRITPNTNNFYAVIYTQT